MKWFLINITKTCRVPITFCSSRPVSMRLSLCEPHWRAVVYGPDGFQCKLDQSICQKSRTFKAKSFHCRNFKIRIYILITSSLNSRWGVTSIETSQRMAKGSYKSNEEMAWNAVCVSAVQVLLSADTMPQSGCGAQDTHMWWRRAGFVGM